MGEILIAKKKGDKMTFKVTDKQTNRWSPMKYQKIVPNKDYNLLALLLYDLWSMGYNIPAAYSKFRELLNEPDFLFK